MREYLERARQLYMDLWEFHLNFLLDYSKTGNRDAVLDRTAARSMEIGKKYRGTNLEEYACARIKDAMDEIERIIKRLR